MKLKFDGMDLACRRTSEIELELVPGDKVMVVVDGNEVLIGYVDGGWRIFCSSKIQVNQDESLSKKKAESSV